MSKNAHLHIKKSKSTMQKPTRLVKWRDMCEWGKRWGLTTSGNIL